VLLAVVGVIVCSAVVCKHGEIAVRSNKTGHVSVRGGTPSLQCSNDNTACYDSALYQGCISQCVRLVKH
jgi:hypothetical protein